MRVMCNPHISPGYDAFSVIQQKKDPGHDGTDGAIAFVV